MTSINDVKVYSKTKGELIQKIEELVAKNNLQTEIKNLLTKWLQWERINDENIKLEELSDNDFYRAFCDSRGIFGIQVWKQDGNFKILQYDKYLSEAYKLYDTQLTTILDNEKE